jgi:hypothetical protein
MALGDDPTMFRDHLVWSRDGRFNMLVPPGATRQIQLSFDEATIVITIPNRPPLTSDADIDQAAVGVAASIRLICPVCWSCNGRTHRFRFARCQSGGLRGRISSGCGMPSQLWGTKPGDRRDSRL